MAMSDVAAEPTREEQMLARLAELDLLAAEKAHAKLMAAEEASEIAEAGRTYQRMARSLRQTLAVKARLAREREAAEAARPRRAVPPLVHEGLRPLDAARRAHIERVRDAVTPYFEAEHPDWDELDEAMVYDILITLAQEDDEFLDTPVEALVAHVIKELPPPDAEPAHGEPPRPGDPPSDGPDFVDTA